MSNSTYEIMFAWYKPPGARVWHLFRKRVGWWPPWQSYCGGWGALVCWQRQMPADAKQCKRCGRTDRESRPARVYSQTESDDGALR